jgi:hypothetical protein
MNRTPVDSSSMASVGYDPTTLTMEIEFNDGAVYQYFDVPEHTYQGLISAQSVGQYFQAQVRGSYRYARA